jgi:uncharacterized membrane protein YozB (DUF420 family)
MNDLFFDPGFLGTNAPFLSDLTLILILFSSILFTIGWFLAVHKHYQVHRWVQTIATVLNAIVVLSVMIRAFDLYILPGLPGRFFEGTYGVTTVHALVGMVGLLLGIFVDLRGNELVPKRLSFSNYKLFMRTSYAIYMLATLLGVIVYLEVYVGIVL